MHQSSGIALCFSPGGGGQGKCTKVPIFSAALSTLEMQVSGPIAAHQHYTPDPNTSTTRGSRIGGRAGVKKLLRERFN